jgi:uncharacterized protein (TIGR02996 family)
VSERGDFLRAIASNPDDEAAFLVYADWLRERGEDDQADLIVGCRAHNDYQLLTPGAQKLLSGIIRAHPTFATGWTNGMVTSVVVDYPHWNYLAQQPLEDQPVARLRLTFNKATPNHLEDCTIPIPATKLPYLQMVEVKQAVSATAMGGSFRYAQLGECIVLNEKVLDSFAKSAREKWPGVKVTWF